MTIRGSKNSNPWGKRRGRSDEVGGGGERKALSFFCPSPSLPFPTPSPPPFHVCCQIKVVRTMFVTHGFSLVVVAIAVVEKWPGVI